MKKQRYIGNGDGSGVRKQRDSEDNGERNGSNGRSGNLERGQQHDHGGGQSTERHDEYVYDHSDESV